MKITIFCLCLILCNPGNAQFPQWYHGNWKHVQHRVMFRYDGEDSVTAIYDSVKKAWDIRDTLGSIKALIAQNEWCESQIRRLEHMVYAYANRKICDAAIVGDTLITEKSAVLSYEDINYFSLLFEEWPARYVNFIKAVIGDRYRLRKKQLQARRLKGLPPL